MWDVAWTDPERELVGDHRGIKDSDRSDKEKSSSRNSISTTSSKASGHSALSRLRARALRHSSSLKEPNRPNVYTSSEPWTPNSSSNNLYPPNMLDTAADQTSALLMLNGGDMNPDAELGNVTHSTLPNGHSATTNMKSKAPKRSMSISSTTTQANENDVFSLKGKEREQMKSLASISRHAKSSMGFHDRPEQQFDLQSPIRQSFTASPSLSPRSPTRESAPNPNRSQDLPVKPIPLTRSPLRPLPKRALAGSSINNMTAWRSPREWGIAQSMIHTVQQIETVTGVKCRKSETVSPERLLDLCDLTTEVKDMARAKPSVALSKLKEPIGDSLVLEESLKLHGEKKRWMLSVMHHLDRDMGLDSSEPGNQTAKPEQPNQPNILAAYEPGFSARYLAALWPDTVIHHLSDNPLSSESAPNICAIYCPTVSRPFPEILHVFDSAYSMALPSHCRESDITMVLNNVNKCLKSGAPYNLVLIDPIPNTSALGENMRCWFRNNLLLNLKQKSRCLTPSFTFPQALGKTSLRGPGSTLTTTKFYANPKNIHYNMYDTEIEAKRQTEGKETRAELRSIVGRMLWREVWGEFVTSDTWWWDDPACMQECLELGTFWVYHTIQAIKSN